MNNFLVVVLGPTGIGKTDTSVDLAERLNCEIISADSRQFFREMRIGTAVPSDINLKKIRHHFIRSLSVEDYYSASMYERDVLDLLPDLFARNNIVLITGGSGLYIDAVCNGYDDIPDVDPIAREKYISMYKKEGIEGLRSALRLLDPEYYSRVDLRNHKRIMRALETCDTTGKPYSSLLKKNKRKRDFSIIKIGLTMDRKDLYCRINSRVDEMVETGLEKEAEQLIKYRALNALNCVGYKEFFDSFDGNISREKAIELIKRNSRRYAKRQLTWWGKDKDIRWFQAGNREEIYQYIKSLVGR